MTYRGHRPLALALLAALPYSCRKETPAAKPADTIQSSHGADAQPATTTQLTASQASPPSTADAPLAADETIYLPKSSKPGERVPFILWLHGLGASGSLLKTALHVDTLAEQYRFAYSTPDGSLDSKRRRFWNACPACCDFDHQGLDHVARLTKILDHARTRADIDAGRVFVIGFSNGGFMAHRLACSPAANLTGIASMAGLGPSPDEACAPARPPLILEVHGAIDVVVRPEGGRLFDDPRNPPHPALRVTLDAWAKRNHCDLAAHTSSALDLVPNLPGKETTQLIFARCAAGVELWTLAGGSHMSVNAPGIVDAVVQRLIKR